MSTQRGSKIEPDAGTGGVVALERGLRLLLVLGRERGATLSELARATGLSKTTALRLLKSLDHYAFTVRELDGRYRLGPSLLVLTGSSTQNEVLASIVSPTLASLAEATGETAAVFVRYRDERLCVAHATGWHPISHNLQVGDLLPMSAGASAEVLAEFADGRPETFDGGLRHSLGARVPELAALAAPIFDAEGRLLAALSISGTCVRFSEAHYLDGLRSKLRASTSWINDQLSMRRPPKS